VGRAADLNEQRASGWQAWRVLGEAVGGAALIYLATQLEDQRLASVALFGFLLVCVDLLVVSAVRTVRDPRYGWPFLIFVVVVAALSAWLRP
jgi:uncharacterized membrane protein HdeD (DUF308 family)